jgi:phosphohistidine phosphatase
MKTLYLIRHAKSSWSFELGDHDRPLNKRGRKDVLKMGRFLSDNHQTPDLLITSTASRAFYTALHFCDAFGLDEELIKLDKSLFHSSPDEILNSINKCPTGNTIALFGHNPGLTLAANLLGGTNFDNIPTCGAVGIRFQVDNWQDVTYNKGQLLFYHYPKGI